MRILFVNFEYPPLGGGGAVINAQIAEEMAKKHKVVVLTSQALGLPKENVENGVRVVRTPVYFRKEEPVANLPSMFAFILQGIATGKQMMEKYNFDVVNTHFALPSGPVGDYLALHAGIPHVLSVQGGDLYDPSKFTSPHRHPLLRFWVRRLIKRADVVVGASKNSLANLRRFYTSEVEAKLIPLGIARPNCYSNLRHKAGFKDEDVLMVVVGRLVPRKSIEQLIAMTKRLKNERVHLLVVGSGPEELSLKAAANRLGISEQVHFYGYVEECEKYRILEMSDMYVSTSQHEGFCLSFLEAMHARLPIVCYNHGGHTDYLEDGVTGFVIPLNNLDLFTERTRNLIEETEMRVKMGVHNRILVEDYYIDKHAAKYEDLFLKTING